jgi:hypothetical protein
MLPPVENAPAQGQPQDPRYVDMGYYDMANGHPPHRDHAIDDDAGVARDVPAQAAGPPAPVCNRPHSSAYTRLTKPFAEGD